MQISKTKSYNKREFNKILINNGFLLVRQRGSHNIFKRGSEEIVISNNLNYMIAKRLVKTYGLV